MAYFKIEHSDGTLSKLYLAKVVNIEYINNNIDYTKSFPNIAYYGTPIRNIIKRRQNDTWKLLRDNGEYITSLDIVYTLYDEIVQGQIENVDTLTNIVSSHTLESYRIKYGTRTICVEYFGNGLGIYEPEQNRVQVQPDSFIHMLGTDFKSNNLFLINPNELLLTGGCRYKLKEGTQEQSLSTKYAKGKYIFSDLSLKATTEYNQSGYVFHTKFYGKNIINQYYNDANSSTIGQTGYYPVYRRASDTTSFNTINKLSVGLNTTMAADITDSDPNIDPNAPEDADDSPPKGDSDDSTEAIPIPIPPVIEVMNALIKVYKIEPEQLILLNSELWTSDFLKQLINIMANPIDNIISLGIIFTNKMTVSNEESIYIGNIKSSAVGRLITQPYIQLTSDPIYVPLYYGSWADYSTKITLYLPYYGNTSLPNYVMGKSIQIVYNIDIISLNALIMILCYTQETPVIIQRYSVNIAYRIPISGRDAQAYVSSIFSPNLATAFNFLTNSDGVINGGISGNTCYLDIQYPYIIMERKNKAIPSNYPYVSGAPACYYSILSSLKGFTSVEDIKLDIATATDFEINEIYRLLREGIYI